MMPMNVPRQFECTRCCQTTSGLGTPHSDPKSKRAIVLCAACERYMQLVWSAVKEAA